MVELYLCLPRSFGLLQYLALPSCPHQILGLDFTRAHLPILGALFDILYQPLLLVLQFDPLTVELTLSLLECSLVFTQPLARCEALPKGPFDNLTIVI